jgi:hypothetical protein
VTAPAAPTPPPAWLPPHIPFSGDWSAFVTALYAVFSRDFKTSFPWFQGRPVWHNRRVFPDGDGKEEGFWHLVTREQWIFDQRSRKKIKERLPELDRAGRVPWARPIIEHPADPQMLVWEFEDETKRGPAVRTYVWLQPHDYVVVLERQAKERGDIYQLITSFWVDYPGKREDLESRYARRK